MSNGIRISFFALESNINYYLKLVAFDHTTTEAYIENKKDYIYDQFLERIDLENLRKLYPAIEQPHKFIINTLLTTYGTEMALKELREYVHQEDGDKIYEWICSFLMMHIIHREDDTVASILHYITLQWKDCNKLTPYIVNHDKRLSTMFAVYNITNRLHKQYYIYISAMFFSRFYVHLGARKTQGVTILSPKVFDLGTLRQLLGWVEQTIKYGTASVKANDHCMRLVEAVSNYNTDYILDYVRPSINPIVLDKILEMPLDKAFVVSRIARWRYLTGHIIIIS